MVCQRCGAENPGGKAACWNCLGPLEGRMAEVRFADVEVRTGKSKAPKVSRMESREGPAPKAAKRERAAPRAATAGGGGFPITQGLILVFVLVGIAVVLFFAMKPVPHPEREGGLIKSRPGAGTGEDPSDLPTGAGRPPG